MAQYPGGKNGPGVFQRLINQIPPHSVYIEPFLGGGAVMRLKRPALLNIGVDLASGPIATFGGAADRQASPLWALPDPLVGNGDSSGGIARSGDVRSIFRFVRADGIDFLASYAFTGSEFVYCDPPYMHARRGRADLYQFEMSNNEHVRLLRTLKRLDCAVMLSGYFTPLYARELHGWRSTTFQTMTRAGRTATEWLWMNYPEPVALHDYRYLGEGFRERERIKRKKLRWVNRLRRMPLLERRALLAAIDLADSSDVAMEACSRVDSGDVGRNRRE